MSAPDLSSYPVLSDMAELFAEDPEFALLVRKAELLSHARSLPHWLKGNAVDLLFVLQAGKERGMSTWEAINGLYPSEDGNGLALLAATQRAMLHRAGWGWRVVESTNDRCTVALTDPDQPDRGEIVETYTMQDALLAELPSGPNAGYWRRFPSRMLYARVTTQAVNAHASHVVRGTPTAMGGLHTDDPAPLPVAEKTPTHTPEPATHDSSSTPPDAATATPGPPTTTDAPHADEPAPTENNRRAEAAPELIRMESETGSTAPGPPARPDTSSLTEQAPTNAASIVPSSQPGRDDKQQAWVVLRRIAESIKPVGVYRVLDNDGARIAKEREQGRLSVNDEHALREAHALLGLSPQHIYRELLANKAPTTMPAAKNQKTGLKPAPRPAMPDLCTCEQTDATNGEHAPDCLAAQQ